MYVYCQVAGVISSVIVLITILKIGALFEDLPKVTLSLSFPMISISLGSEFNDQ